MNIIEAGAVLQVSPPFTAVQLLAAYRRGAMTRHPDRGGSDDLFRELTAAYEFMRPLAHASVSDSGDDRLMMTSDGTPLSELGQGYPLTKSAKTCDHCGGAGYNTEENHSGASIECPKCVGHGIVSYPCRRCGGTGKVNGKECYTCHGTGRFFPGVTAKEIKDGIAYDKNERPSKVQASVKAPVYGRVCFECNGVGRINYEEDLFAGFWNWNARSRSRSNPVGRSYVNAEVTKTGCTIKEAQQRLGFKALTTRTTYFKCSACHGVGEVEMWNPVLPRGLFAAGKR